MATTTGFGVSQTLSIDLAKPGIPKMVYAMQGEGYTRTVSLKIYDDGVLWSPPTDAAYEVSYCKPDGTGGTYNSYTTDSSKHAVTVNGSRLDVVLIPQMLEVAGMVRCEVHMRSSAIMAYAERLSTFTFFVSVQASAESGITSTDYWASARADKVVLYKGNVLAEADVYVSPEADYFLSTPHIGDTVVGSNGYIGVVTAASGSSVTFKTTGARWTNPGLVLLNSNVTSVPDLTQEYYWTQFGWTPSVGDVVIGLDGCLAKVTAITSTKDGGKATIKMLGIRGLDVARMGGVPESRTVGGHELSDDVDLTATDIGYTGKVGEYEVSSVGGALEALVNTIGSYQPDGNYLELTGDYQMSGATSVEQWATMAAVAENADDAAEAEDAGDDAEATYRVNAGRYRIAVTADQEASDVTIMDVPNGTGRIVLISHINSDPFWYFDVYGVSAPGGDPESLLSLSTEEGLLNVGDGCVKLLPGYDKSADADKILMLKRGTSPIDTSVYPQWVALTNVAEEGA